MGNLGGADNGNLVIDIHIGKGYRKLDMAVRNLRRIIHTLKSEDIFLSILFLPS